MKRAGDHSIQLTATLSENEIDRPRKLKYRGDFYIDGTIIMNIAKATILLLLLLGVTLPASAALKGNKLLQHCTGYATNYMVCQGYIMGVVDTTNTWESVGQAKPEYCLPQGITLPQLVQVSVAGLQASSTVLGEEASGLVIIALRAAFPCEAPATEAAPSE